MWPAVFTALTLKNFLIPLIILKQSTGPVPTDRKVVIAIAPHAGYPYSGPVAAYTFKAIARNHYKTMVVIGPSHFFPFEGFPSGPREVLKHRWGLFLSTRILPKPC